MAAAYQEVRDLPLGEERSEYLSVADLPPGETRATIEFVEGFNSKSSLLHLREHKKPIVMNHETFISMSRDFGEGQSGKWTGRAVVLSADGDDVSMKASIKPVPPLAASAPKTNLATELADALMRAIAPPHSRTDAIAILRAAADILAARQ